MLFERVLEKAMYVSEQSVYDLLFENDIKLAYDDCLIISDTDGYLSIYNNNSTIFLKPNLHVNRERFIILHELGHFFLDYKPNSLFYMNQNYKGRYELRANLFACLCLLKNVDLSNLNIISYLMCHGCPRNIAISFFDYAAQNMLPYINSLHYSN